MLGLNLEVGYSITDKTEVEFYDMTLDGLPVTESTLFSVLAGICYEHNKEMDREAKLMNQIEAEKEAQNGL